MLKKLFKYEWKFFWKVPATINLALIIITLVGITSFITPLWTIESTIIDILMVTGLMFYIIAIFAGSIAISVYIAIRFYKSIYTDEGYLTNTLPVTPRQIVLSKLFVSSIWTFITVIVIFISIFTLIFVSVFSYSDINVFYRLSDSWKEIKVIVDYELGYDGFKLTVYMILSILYTVISTFFSILMLFSAISLGQLFTRHKVAGAVGWYIGEFMIVQFTLSVLQSIPVLLNINNTNYRDFASFFDPMFYGSIILTLVCSFGLFFLTEYMMKRKLNLD